MALDLRPNCEWCDCELAADSQAARICSYECTFCVTCVDEVLLNVCPNCGGGFAPRPIRPKQEWRPGLSLQKRPPSTKRIRATYGKADIEALARKLAQIAPAER